MYTATVFSFYCFYRFLVAERKGGGEGLLCARVCVCDVYFVSLSVVYRNARALRRRGVVCFYFTSACNGLVGLLAKTFR